MVIQVILIRQHLLVTIAIDTTAGSRLDSRSVIIFCTIIGLMGVN